MFHRLRLLATGSVLIFWLGVVYVGASAAASARISAHLTSTSFTASQAGSVNLVYGFSSKSSRFAYVLSRKAGNAWSAVRSVSTRGSFRGSHTMTVKSVFGSRPITVGQYRLKLSSSANNVTLSFTVVPPATPPATVKPNAGSWSSGPLNISSTGGLGTATITGLFFTVAADRSSVSPFHLNYTYKGTAPTNDYCLGENWGSETVPSPIADGQFSNPPGTVTWTSGFFGLGRVDATATFHMTFDSATTAHGNAQVTVSMSGPPPFLGEQTGIRLCYPASTASTDTFSWTATWHSS